MTTSKKFFSKRIDRLDIAVVMLKNWGYMQYTILSTPNGVSPSEFHARPYEKHKT